jgi:nitrogenase molybdenum-iron protein beta chain
MSKYFIERPRYVCALGGATATISALPGGIPILHSASGCAGNFAWSQNGGSGLQVGGYCGTLTVPSSNVQERDIVFGGDARLREQIESTLKVMDGSIYAVLTGCVTEVIGDDIKTVVADFRSQGIPIIGAETGGFKGNSYWGYDLALQALFRDFVAHSTVKVKKQVNLWGIVPSADPFWRGNLEGVRRLLEALGLTVNSFFTHEDTIENIRAAGSAELNVVVSHVYGVEAAKVFEEVHGTPFISLSLPMGASASESFLRGISKALNISRQRVNSVINQEKQIYFRFLEPLTDCFNDLDLQRYAVVVGDANYATALTKFLADDLGWLPELTVCTDPLDDEEKDRLAGQLKRLESHYKTTLVFETDGGQAINHLQKKWPPASGQKYHNAFSPAFVVGSSLERELAQTIGAPHLSVSFPVANRAVLDRGYTGFRGGLRLVEDILSTVVAGR